MHAHVPQRPLPPFRLAPDATPEQDVRDLAEYAVTHADDLPFPDETPEHIRELVRDTWRRLAGAA